MIKAATTSHNGETHRLDTRSKTLSYPTGGSVQICACIERSKGSARPI